VVVTDRDLANVQVFTENGEFIMKWGSEGEGDGQLSKPESSYPAARRALPYYESSSQLPNQGGL
jgi:hypothetical protein